MQHSTHHFLRAWYDTHGRRTLPWRNTDDPYAIYISEVMLQQTQVQTVLDRYYAPFLEQFPSLQALADTPLEAVLKAWEGLGYYSRARNLHHAAQHTAPALPTTIDGLMRLKGIGKNTAHAIAAFAYHQPVAVMEANVKRVIHRMMAAENLTENALWEIATVWVDKEDPFTYNQAMMDIGAMICTIKHPQCLLCPLSADCKGKENPTHYPAAKAKKIIPVRHQHIIVVRANERYYLTPRTSQFLGGLYGFPAYAQEELPMMVEGSVTPPMEQLLFLGGITQSYSHFQLQAEVYLWEYPHAPKTDSWYSLTEIAALPLSRADSKVVGLLNQ